MDLISHQVTVLNINRADTASTIALNAPASIGAAV